MCRVLNRRSIKFNFLLTPINDQLSTENMIENEDKLVRSWKSIVSFEMLFKKFFSLHKRKNSTPYGDMKVS
jgi:hypothetical protein